MARLCERPGCSQVAAFLYAIDAEHLTVWLEPFESGGSDRAGVLCRRHADAMVVPLGWMLDDRRTQAPQLFRTLSPPAATSTGDRSRRQRAGTAAAVEALQLSLDAAEESPTGEMADAVEEEDLRVAAEPVDLATATGGERTPPFGEVAPTSAKTDGTAAADPSMPADPIEVLPWRPVFDQSDDLDGLLTASSPLLRRAFGRNPPPVE